jgi:hypothetical protein
MIRVLSKISTQPFDKDSNPDKDRAIKNAIIPPPRAFKPPVVSLPLNRAPKCPLNPSVSLWPSISSIKPRKQIEMMPIK